MNLVARQNFAHKASIGTNTEIGGVALTISTPALLATKLGISVGAISNFSIVGSDIKCKITGSYSIPIQAFEYDANITYYLDNDNLVTQLNSKAFYYASNFSNFKLEGVTSISGDRIFEEANLSIANLPNLTSTVATSLNQIKKNKERPVQVYIPNCTTLGSNVNVNEDVFFGLASGSILYLNPSLATSNSGSEEADVAYARSIGCIVRYVTSFTAPSAITTLSAGTVYNTAIQLAFTPPSSTNTIDYYDVYVNGIYNNRITSSGGYAIGLTASTAYSISVYAVDVFYNKSAVSNILTQTTTSTNTIASETTAFESRITTDSGVLIDKPYINDEWVKLISNGLNSNILFWHNYKSGFKKDGSNLVEKMYSFAGSNTDIAQTTTANKPLYTTGGVTFDLTDVLTKTLSPTITNKSFTIMWRLKSTPGNYYPQISLSPGSWDGFQMHSESGGGIYAGISVANRFHLTSGSFLTNTDATYTFTYNASSKIAQIYRNTTLLDSKIMVDPINFSSLSIDAQNGTFYDSKMFNKDLSLTEITNIL